MTTDNNTADIYWQNRIYQGVVSGESRYSFPYLELIGSHNFTDGQDVTGMYELKYQCHNKKKWIDLTKHEYDYCSLPKRIVAVPLPTAHTENKVESKSAEDVLDEFTLGVKGLVNDEIVIPFDTALLAMEAYRNQPLPESTVQDKGCPCLYLDKPCHDRCTCVNGFSSTGCAYCCTYGSIEQRKEKAEMLEKRYSASTVPVQDIITHLKWMRKYITQGFPKNVQEKLNYTAMANYNLAITEVIEWLSKQLPPSPPITK